MGGGEGGGDGPKYTSEAQNPYFIKIFKKLYYRFSLLQTDIFGILAGSSLPVIN